MLSNVIDVEHVWQVDFTYESTLVTSLKISSKSSPTAYLIFMSPAKTLQISNNLYKSHEILIVAVIEWV